MARFLKASPAFAGSRPASLSNADAVIWGIPTDCGAGTGRLGAKRGPKAIREASRIWNTARTSSGFQFPDHGGLVDLGDVDLAGAKRADVRRRIAAAAPPIEPGRLNVMLGGDHSVTRPVLEAAGGRWGLIYMDAHPDCIDAYHGDRDSHACVVRRLVESGRVDPRRTVVLGMSAPEAEEVEWLAKHRVEAITSWQVAKTGIEKACRRATQIAGGGPLYLSIDMDVIEAGSVPGVENPEPGGISTREALWAMDFFGRRADAADLVEVSGDADPAGITAKTAARMLFDLIGAHIEQKGRKVR
ncbi:MAG TPA: arginase family protein [Planctomycetota bacterium]|nr:arginase family protein [Planctomycetota bacterium]